MQKYQRLGIRYRPCAAPRDICKTEVEGVCITPRWIQGIRDAVLPGVGKLRQIQRNREEIHEIERPVNKQVAGIRSGIVDLTYSVTPYHILIYPVVGRDKNR